jgi:hypothetical protein
MKKHTLIYIAIAILFFGCSKNDLNDESNVIQDGTIEHPFLIQSKSDLIEMRDRINNENSTYGNKVYKLMSNIDLAGEPDWIPIGNNSENAFKGIFIGNDFKITNIKIGSANVTSELENAGFFGVVINSEIENLGVVWESLNSSRIGGGIISLAIGTKLTSCYSSGVMFSSAGCLAGKTIDSQIDNCHSDAMVSCHSGAGIVLSAENCLITNCFFEGNITAQSKASGIAGEGDSKCIIDNCYLNGNISSNRDANGIAYRRFIIKNSHSSGEVSGKSSANGIAELSDLIINCYSNATIIAENFTNSINSGYSYASGIASNALVINCYSSGDVTALGKISHSAGIIVENPKGIENCYSSSNIKSEGSWFTYIAGIATNNSTSEKIKDCLALNKSMIAINPKDEIRMLYRIANAYHDTNRNYSNLNEYYVGTSDSDLSLKKFIDDNIRHGTIIEEGFVEKLNEYVLQNPTYQGVPLNKWKVQVGVNDGMPIFDN